MIRPQTLQVRPLRALSLALLASLAASCTGIPVQQPWSPVRGARAVPLPDDTTQVRASLVGNEENAAAGSAFAGLEYGLSEDLTVGFGIGGDAKRSDDFQEGEASAIYRVNDPEDSVWINAHLDINLLTNRGPGSSKVEFRPGMSVLMPQDEISAFAARAGLSVIDGADPGFFVETAYWDDLGGLVGMIELDGEFREEADELYLTPSAVAQIRELVQLQIGIPIGLTSESADWQMLVGLLIRF